MLLTYFKRRNNQWSLTVKCFEIKYILGIKKFEFVCTAYNEILISKITNIDINKLYKMDANTYVYMNDFFTQLFNDNHHAKYLD
jgi:hypothetical protein